MSLGLRHLMIGGVIGGCLAVSPATALVQMFLSDLSLAAHGWVPPGGTVNISTNVTANVGGVPAVRIGYAIINAETDALLTRKSASFNLTQGQPTALRLDIPIPSGAPQGKYRAELQVLSASGSVMWSDPRSVCFTVTNTPPRSDGFQLPVRGCSELPSSDTNLAMNYIYASGSQLVDLRGTPLKISALEWGGATRAGAAQDGLSTLNYKRVLESIKTAGFNTVSIPWTDGALYARPAPPAIDAENRTANAALRDPAFPRPVNGRYVYRKTIDIFQFYADYAAQIGLKVIFHHDGDRGEEQPNGLWFSKDSARNYCSDGQYIQWIDGAGAEPPANFGRCDADGKVAARFTDYETFKQNTVALARKFANHPAVIGFELHRGGHYVGKCESGQAWVQCAPVERNWGQTNDKYDVKWMSQDVGDALHDANADALVIVDGYPVTLAAQHKTVYQDVSLSPGAAPNTAPVMRTQLGACIQPGVTPAQTLETLDAAIAAASNGPLAYNNRQWMSTNWLRATTRSSPLIGCDVDPGPNGMWTGWPTGDFVPFSLNRPETLAITDKLLFRGSGDVSGHNTVVGAGGSIIVPSRHYWAIMDGHVLFDGTIEWDTSNAVTVAYANDRLCYRNTAAQWFCKGSVGWIRMGRSPLQTSANGFVSVNGGPPVIDAAGNVWELVQGRALVNGAEGPPGPPNFSEIAWAGGRIWARARGGWYWVVPPAAWSSNPATPPLATSGTKVVTEGGGAIIDASGTRWMIVDGRVVMDGLPDQTTRNVIELAYYDGKIWQKNDQWLWRSKASRNADWAPAGGQNTRPPLPVTPNNRSVGSGTGSIVTATPWSWDWAIANGKVVIDGVVDESTKDVVQLAYSRGKVWQKNAAGLWWSKASMMDTWLPAGGTATAPF